MRSGTRVGSRSPGRASTQELREELGWQEALSDHGAEIGESMGGAHTKAERLRAEISKREWEECLGWS